MFSLLLKLKRRIKRLLKVQTESRQKRALTVRSKTIKSLFLVVFSVLIAVFYPGEEIYQPLDIPHKGETAQQDILAPFDITVYKSDREIKDEEEQIRFSIPYLIDYDTSLSNSAFNGLRRFVRVVDSLRQKNDSSDSVRHAEYVRYVSQKYPLLSRTAIERSLDTSVRLSKLLIQLEKIYSEEVYKVGVLRNLNDIPPSRNKMVVIRRGGRETIHQRDQLKDIAMVYAQLVSALNRLGATDSIDVDYYYLVGKNFIQPNLWVNMEEYEHRVDEQLAQISNVRRLVKTSDIIVREGQKVTEPVEEILIEMARLQHLQAAKEGWFKAFLPVLARIVLVLAIFTALYLFLFYFRKVIFHSNPKLLALFLVFALQLFLVYMVDFFGGVSIYLYPVAVLPIMVTILFDAEVGILSTIILALLFGIMHRFNFSITLMTMIVGLVACFTSRSVRKRSHFYRIMLSIVLSYLLLIILVESLKFAPNPEILEDVVYGVVNGIITIPIIFFLLPFFESLFGFTTDSTLLELSDLNHPLLKRLAIEAPGTYHHSIIIGNLAEAAAKAINANSLLARVGSYYHDIGKMEIPEYFVENQLGVTSKHESLTPTMSSLILSSHVKKGRVLGEEADIPDDVLNFIEEHHGTMVMSYFYNRAMEQGADPSTIDKFRYPGPKPQTRETGIVMLADAVEAASRTLEDPKPARINNLIQRIISDRFQSGELEECPLTLRDLALIKEAFAQVLIAAFHHRVVYPKKDDEE
ncbi:MAG: HDIG domain-containing protein [candidate division Zixibacteria bacterium]|nr:HDIG domain-containing protein [candidate division Zixibacteria bacterium]